MNETVVVAIVGVIGTLVAAAMAPWTQSMLTRRQDHEARLQDARATLYSEAMLFAQTMDVYCETVTIPECLQMGRTPNERRKLDEATPVADLISARMWLLAPESIRSAWEKVVSRYEALQWDIRENSPEAGFDSEWHLADDDQGVVSLAESVSRLRATLRKAMGVTD